MSIQESIEDYKEGKYEVSIEDYKCTGKSDMQVQNREGVHRSSL
ncbi:hypothetical protein T08_11315 [Trichinella sp. T8]|nr:hypothetical protein T08_11315 [Trichinella sp. T8]